MIEIVDANTGSLNNRGVAVLIDVFRASTSILVMLKNRAVKIVSAYSIEHAHALKKEYPDAIMAGERNGEKVPEFEFGNSPVELSKQDLSGKTVIFVSTNGTRILHRLKAERIYIAAFLNAKKVAELIKTEKYITLVAANRIDLYSIEDFKCAEYIRSLILNEPFDFEEVKGQILRSKSAERLRELNAEDDMLYSLEPAVLNVVPVYNNGVITTL